MPASAPASMSEWHTLLPSPTNASVRPRRSPRCCRRVRRSASAWQGCSWSDSAFTTGTDAADRPARRACPCPNVREHDPVDPAAQVAADVGRGLAVADPDLLRAEVHGVPAELGDADVERDPRPQARLLEQERDRPSRPGAPARDPRAAAREAPRPRRGGRASPSGSRSPIERKWRGVAGNARTRAAAVTARGPSPCSSGGAPPRTRGRRRAPPGRRPTRSPRTRGARSTPGSR